MYYKSRCSSVGRASDWRSEGPQFDPGRRHYHSFFCEHTSKKKNKKHTKKKTKKQKSKKNKWEWMIGKNDASTGNRTRTSCLGSTNSDHWTIDAKLLSLSLSLSLSFSLTGPTGIWTRIRRFRVSYADHYTISPKKNDRQKKLWWGASTGNRTRTSCLEGTNSNHWTIDANNVLLFLFFSLSLILSIHSLLLSFSFSSLFCVGGWMCVCVCVFFVFSFCFHIFFQIERTLPL